MDERWKIISLLLGDDWRAPPVQTGHRALSSDEWTHAFLGESKNKHDTTLIAGWVNGTPALNPSASSRKLKLSSPLSQAGRSTPANPDHLEVKLRVKPRRGDKDLQEAEMSQSTTPQRNLAIFYHFKLSKKEGFAHSFTRIFFPSDRMIF